MREWQIAVLTAFFDLMELVFIPFPFNIITFAVTTFLGLFAIHRKQRARTAKRRNSALEGWD